MILTLTGPSGVGKTTLLENLLNRLPDARLLESTTTRAPRPSDEAAFAYVSDETFTAMESRGEFLWSVHPHGKRYGTRKAAVDEALAGGLSISILVISAVAALHAYAKQLGNAQEVKSLYIGIDDEAELRKRFAARGDMAPQEVESRIAECRSWEAQARASGIPFLFLDGKLSREELCLRALAFLRQ